MLLSDGMLEAKRQDDDLFGKGRILEMVRQHRSEPAKVIVEKLILAVRNHCAPQSPDDDLTAVVIKVA
jgi:serine phosphatase RsbU (regulator of sigma subunit)